MKRILTSFAWAAAGMILLSSCLKDNYDGTVTEYQVTRGALVLNAGTPDQIFNGSLSYIDFNSLLVQADVFQQVNHEELAGFPTDILVRGGKVYVAGNDVNIVYVLDKTSFQLIKEIDTEEEMGGNNGLHPRRLCAYGDKVYVSTSGACVGVIDTLTLSISKQYMAVSFPEGMAISVKDDVPYLYVANSDDGYGFGSITTINLSTGENTKSQYEEIRYPLDLAVAGDQIFVLDGGYYDEDGVQQDAGVYLINGTHVQLLIPDATNMTGVNYSLLTYNAPKDPGKTLSYSLYNLIEGTTGPFYLSRDSHRPILAPTAISIEPNSGYVMVGSHPVDDNGVPKTDMCGYVNLYTSNGTFVNSYDVGIGPRRIAFVHETVQVK